MVRITSPKMTMSKEVLGIPSNRNVEILGGARSRKPLSVTDPEELCRKEAQD